MRQRGWCVPILCAWLAACSESTPTSPSGVTVPAATASAALTVSGSVFIVGPRPAGALTIHAPGVAPTTVLPSGQFTLQAPRDLTSLTVRFDGREATASLPMTGPSGDVTLDLRLDTSTARVVVTRMCTSSGPPPSTPGVSATLCVGG